MKPAEFYMRDRAMHPPAYTPSYKTSVLRSPLGFNATAATRSPTILGNNAVSGAGTITYQQTNAITAACK